MRMLEVVDAAVLELLNQFGQQLGNSGNMTGKLEATTLTSVFKESISREHTLGLFCFAHHALGLVSTSLCKLQASATGWVDNALQHPYSSGAQSG